MAAITSRLTQLRESILNRVAQSSPIFSSLSSRFQALNEVYRDQRVDARESLASIELALDDAGYRRLTANTDREFSRDGLKDIINLSRTFYLKNPLINRAVEIQALYVWGRGVTITSEDEGVQKRLDAIVADPINQHHLFSSQARHLRETDLAVTGNLFISFHDLGSATDIPRFVPIPSDEIQDIIVHPVYKVPLFYKRVFTPLEISDNTSPSISQRPRAPITRFHPSLFALGQTWQDGDKPMDFKGVAVEWDVPVHHIAVGCLGDMKFGVPETFQALDWAGAYKQFLSAWHSIVRSLASYTWNLNVQGGAPAVNAARAKLNSTLANSPSLSSFDTNPPPVAGSTFISSNGAQMEPFKVAGATVPPEEGRRILLMVCASFGLPETFFGDVSVGTLATGKSLDRPTELKFAERQELWKSILYTLLSTVLNPPNSGVRESDTLSLDIADQLSISFPPILEHDVMETVSATIAAATLNGQTNLITMTRETLARKLLETVGIENIGEELEKMEMEWARMDMEKEIGALNQGVNTDTGESELQKLARVIYESTRTL